MDNKRETTLSGHRFAMRAMCWLVLLLSGVVYGSSFSFMKLAVDGGAHPIGLAFWFAFVSAIGLLIVVAVRRGPRMPPPNVIAFAAIWGVLGTVVPNILFFYSAREIPAGVIAMAVALVPIMTFAGAVVLGRDSLSIGRAIGIFLGFLGALLIVLPEASLPETKDTFWVILAFMAAGSYAIEYNYFGLKAPPDVPADLLMLLMFAASTMMLLFITFATGTFVVPAWPFETAEYAVLAVSLSTIIDYWLFILLIGWAGSVFASQAAYVVTLAGVFWGIVIFGEIHSGWIWMALILLIAGIGLVQPRSND